MADFSKQFILQADASGVALEAVLSQEVDGVRQTIAYASRTLSAQERKAASTYKLECLAVLMPWISSENTWNIKLLCLKLIIKPFHGYCRIHGN
jgi:hypothetical protein